MTKKATNCSTAQGDVYVDEYFKVHWRVLPTKANQEMEQAGADAAREYLERNGHNNLWVIYEAMTAAAPTPPHFEADELSALLPKPEDDSELPVVGEAIYDAWDMAQQWNGCRENFLPIVMRLKAERDTLNALLLEVLELIDDGVGRSESEWQLIRKLRAALHASAEPSAPIERDEREAFEKFCVDSHNRCCKPKIPMKMELMLAARSGDEYRARGWTDMWKGWKARAALDQGTQS